LTFRPAPATYTLFSGTRLTQTQVTDAMPEETRRSVCWLAFAASDVVKYARVRALTDVATALGRLDTRWDNFMNRGYSMLPHEVLINGWMPRRQLEPPRAQLVVLHPSAGTQVVASTLRTLRDAHREDVLTLEPAGLVTYGPQHAWYAGASWLVTFPSTSRMGNGVMLHFSKVGHLAYVWRPREADGKRRNGLLVSIDLYQHLTGAAERWKKLKATAITACETLAKACVKQ
jgi:hypothetical protein